MNIATKLPQPLSTFEVDVPANTYYDFEVAPDSTYPLKGVTYPVDYGNIPGYIAEDGHELDLFVGNDVDGELGSIVVDRGEAIPNEHKYYVALSKDALNAILEELTPVLLDHKSIVDIPDLLSEIEEYKTRG